MFVWGFLKWLKIGGGDKVGVEIGLILGLITAALQTVILGAGLASRHDDRGTHGTPYPDRRPKRTTFGRGAQLRVGAQGIGTLGLQTRARADRR